MFVWCDIVLGTVFTNSGVKHHKPNLQIFKANPNYCKTCPEPFTVKYVEGIVCCMDIFNFYVEKIWF